jgi:MFS family permease
MIRRLADSLGANRTVVALSVARLGDAVGNSILFIALPLFVAKLPAERFPVPETVRVGILLSLYGLVSSLAQPLMGALSDRFRRRKLFIQLGLVAMGAGTLGFVGAHHFRDLLALRALQGLGVALTIPASMALMAASTEKRNRGGAMGVYTTMRMVGFATGPLLGGLLLTRLGFDAAFFAGAAAIAVGLVLVQLWVREPAAVTTLEAGEARPAFRVFDPGLLTSGILGVGFATFTMASAFSLMVTLEKQFNDRLHETAAGFGVAFSALMVSRLLFQVPLGHWSDRIGRKPLILAGLVLMAPATAALGWVGSTAQLTGVRLVQGLASAAIAAPAFALAADLARGGGEGRQMAVVTTGFGLGIAVGPLLAGLLATVSFELPFVVGGALALLGGWVVYRWVPETVHRRAAGKGPRPVVRPATVADAAAIAELGERTFRDTFADSHDAERMEVYVAEAFAAETIAAEIADPAVTYLLAYPTAASSGPPLGYAKLEVGEPPACVAGPTPIELARLYVERELHGSGLAAALMDACLDEARRRGRATLWLGVWDRNPRARRFYEKRGMRTVGSKPFLFAGEAMEDLVMARPVGEPGAG